MQIAIIEHIQESEEQHIRAGIHTIIIPFLIVWATGAVLNGFLWIGFMTLIYLKSNSINKSMFFKYAMIISETTLLLFSGLYIIIK